MKRKIITTSVLLPLALLLAACQPSTRYIVPGPSAEANNPPITRSGSPRALLTTQTNARCFDTPPGSVSKDIVAFNNAVRKQVGLTPLKPSKHLDEAASAQACDIARMGRLTHVGLDGTGVSQRLNRSGYLSCFASENIAIQYRTPEQVNAAWFVSKGHHKNMLRDGIANIGVGYADSANGPVWVAVFARRC